MSDDETLNDFINKNYLEPYYIMKASYKLMNEDNELCASHGRTILTTFDGKVIVNPVAPEFVDFGEFIGKLSKTGKDRWNRGLSISYYDCFTSYISKKLLKAGFE